LLFDNGNSTKSSTDAVYEQINADIVEAISIIRGDYSQLSQFGMIDTRDMKEIITQPGLIHINMIKGIYQEKIPSDGSIEDLLVANMKNNTMITPDRDKIVNTRAYIVNLSDDVKSYFNTALPKLTEMYGEATNGFEHYSVNEDDEKANYVIVISSGLSLPENRLKTIQHRIDAAEEALSKKKESSILQSLSEKVGVYSKPASNSEADNSTFNLDDILSKY
jgi:hypothetical protein